MFQSIIGQLYTPDVVSSMGDWYSVIYSWTHFAFSLAFCLVAVIAFLFIIFWIGRMIK